MIDVRFYEALGPVTVRALSSDLPVEGDLDRPIASVAPLNAAQPGDLSYLDAPAPKAPLDAAPGLCICRADMVTRVPRAGAWLIAQSPRAHFARLAHRIIRPRELAAGEPNIHATAEIEPGAVLEPGVIVGPGARIGAGARIGPYAVIGPGVAIGRRTRIGAHAVISFSLIGDDVLILPGAVVGGQGFGVAGDAAGLVDVPHFGRVIVQDRVTIGANSTIDRGVFDDTTIGEEAKIDNLCHIAHNVTLGRRSMIAAFGGISGSTRIGDGVMMGGRVGVSDHRDVGEGASLAAGSAVLQDVPAGETWAGYPAKPIRAWMRELAWVKSKASGKRDGGN